MGFLLPSMKPRYLKLTISPAFGSHRFTNSELPGTAANVTPFGLGRVLVYSNKLGEGGRELVQNTFIEVSPYLIYYFSFCVPKFLFFGSY